LDAKEAKKLIDTTELQRHIRR